MPLAVGGGLPAAAVAEAGASTPSPFRVRSAATIVAEAMAAVPLMVVPMREATIAPVVKSITAIITTPEPVVPVCAPSLAAVVASHKRAMHREPVHLSAMGAPSAAAAMAATTTAATAARQRRRIAQRHCGEADGGDDR